MSDTDMIKMMLTMWMSDIPEVKAIQILHAFGEPYEKILKNYSVLNSIIKSQLMGFQAGKQLGDIIKQSQKGSIGGKVRNERDQKDE